MPVSSQEDYLLRMLRQMGAVLARMLGLKNGGQVHEALQSVDHAEGELLGPLAEVVPRVDSATAAHIVGHPLRIAAWARLLHERADLLRLAGDAAGAALAATRAHELAAEARARAEGYESDVRELLGPLANAAAGPPA
jgi:Tfp pilus assembly protein PilN